MKCNHVLPERRTAKFSGVHCSDTNGDRILQTERKKKEKRNKENTQAKERKRKEKKFTKGRIKKIGRK